MISSNERCSPKLLQALSCAISPAEPVLRPVILMTEEPKRCNPLLLEIRQIHKSFPGVHALENVSMKLCRSEVLGLVGENGAGKFSHDHGSIQIVSTLSQKLTNVKVKAAIFSADGKKQVEKQFKADIPANKTISVEFIKDLISDDELYFIGLDLLEQAGNIIDRTVVWTQKETKWHQRLEIPDVDVESRLLRQGEINGEIEMSKIWAMTREDL